MWADGSYQSVLHYWYHFKSERNDNLAISYYYTMKHLMPLDKQTNKDGRNLPQVWLVPEEIELLNWNYLLHSNCDKNQFFWRKVATEIKREYNTTSVSSDGPISEGIKSNLVLSS